MRINQILGMNSILGWAQKWRKKVSPVAPEPLSFNRHQIGENAKKLRNIHMETEKIKQETNYIRRTGKAPPPRHILGPNGDIKKIR